MFEKNLLNFLKMFHHELGSLALSHCSSFPKLKPNKNFHKLLPNVILFNAERLKYGILIWNFSLMTRSANKINTQKRQHNAPCFTSLHFKSINNPSSSSTLRHPIKVSMTTKTFLRYRTTPTHTSRNKHHLSRRMPPTAHTEKTRIEFALIVLWYKIATSLRVGGPPALLLHARAVVNHSRIYAAVIVSGGHGSIVVGSEEDEE